jgi:hypothetical protein
VSCMDGLSYCCVPANICKWTQLCWSETSRSMWFATGTISDNVVTWKVSLFRRMFNLPQLLNRNVFLGQTKLVLYDWYGSPHSTRDDMERCNWQSWYWSIFLWLNSQKSSNFVLLELTNRGNMELVWFQQDSVLAYFTLNVRGFMNEAFPDRWVFRGSAAFPSTMSWPPCNPDLTTADSSLWGIIKHKLAVHHSTPPTKLTSGHYWCLHLFNTTNATKVLTKYVATHQALHGLWRRYQSRSAEPTNCWYVSVNE